jgi:hypothetical protein
MPARVRRSTFHRGYDHRHVKRREYLLATTPPGTPCPYCHLPMWPGTQRLDADHRAVPLASGQGGLPDTLAHASCNRRAGAVLGNRMRGARRASGRAVPRDAGTSRRW